MTQKARTRRRPARLGGVYPLPPSLAELTPTPVREANEEFARALDRHGEAGAAAIAARDQVEAAAREDERLAAAAVETGDPMPPRLEAEARAKLAEAERTIPAAEGVAADRQTAFLDALIESRDEILATTEEAMRAADAAAARALDELEATMLRRTTLLSLERELRDPGYLQGRSVLFAPREARKPTGAREIETLRAQLGDR
jgi:hypothetical protein